MPRPPYIHPTAISVLKMLRGAAAPGVEVSVTSVLTAQDLRPRRHERLGRPRCRPLLTRAVGVLAEFEPELRSLIAHLLPGVPDHIDLAGFVDSNVGVPLGSATVSLSMDRTALIAA